MGALGLGMHTDTRSLGGFTAEALAILLSGRCFPGSRRNPTKPWGAEMTLRQRVERQSEAVKSAGSFQGPCKDHIRELIGR